MEFLIVSVLQLADEGDEDQVGIYLKRVLRTVGVSFLLVAGRDLSTRSTNLPTNQ